MMEQTLLQHDNENKILSLVKASSKIARKSLTYSESFGLKALPLSYINGKLLIAVCHDYDLSLLKYKTGCDIKPVVIKESLLLQAIFKAYNSDTERFEEVLPEFVPSIQTIPTLSDLSNYTGEVNVLIQRLLEYGLAANISDLHFVPTINGYSLCVRQSGKLLESTNLIFNHDYAKKFVSRIKTLSGLNSLINNLPQDGALKFFHLNSYANFRVSIFPANYGERCVLRILSNNFNYDLKKLGYSEEIQSFLTDILRNNFRLILIAGVTGSGKTTLGYTFLSILRDLAKVVVTVEDPVESYLEKVSQSSIDLKIGFTHEIALRTVLRQDPDILYYGEIRDAISAQACIHASLTGHSVISTIHSGSILEIINRFKSMGISNEELLIQGNVFIHQKLLPKLCRCKKLDYESTEVFDFNIFKATGCSYCSGTGYQGVVPILSACLLKQNYTGGSLEEYLLNNSIYQESYKQLLTYLKQGIISA